ncbi:hypothetical protein BURKHO8Y_240082 [Burkholderia sp. 8Y]|nr:hypothetical protein BURKHO8Y_240082 [Burkholderia sp. 8Y]
MRFGAPGWDRTSNPCLRRAVLYPLSYGRFGGKPCVRVPEDGCKAHANPREYPVSVNPSITRGWTLRAKPHTIRVNARATAPAAPRLPLSVRSIIDRALGDAGPKR